MPHVLLAQAAPMETPVPQWFINAGALLFGALFGGLVAFASRKVLRRFPKPDHIHWMVLADATLVVTATALTGLFELWKSATFKSASLYSFFGYSAAAVVITLGIAAKFILSESKDLTRKEFDKVAGELTRERTSLKAALVVEVLVSHVMNAKMERFAEAQGRGEKSIQGALNPEAQLGTIIEVMHRHFVRKLDSVGKSLRIGVYLKDGSQLIPTLCWDGTSNACFSKKNPEAFDLLSPVGNTRAKVVDAWFAPAEEPFVFVPDTVAEERKGNFRFFYPSQSEHLKSMLAFRHAPHNLQLLSPFVLTLDSDQAGFFSDENPEYRLLIPAFARRIELELVLSSV